jgi:N-acetyl-alpha-D-glucosaminyl L-malate synthase BshA
VTYNQPARLDFFSENLFYHEVAVSKYPLFEYPPYELALASRLVDVVRFEKLDILHVHYAIPHASAAFMAKQILMTYGIYIPVVTTLHGTDITLVGKDRTYQPVVTFSINKSDGVTAVSEHLRKDTFEFFEIENEIRVIPNFIDLTRFSLKAKDHFKKAIAPAGEKILVHTSNFRKVKRTTDVIQIFAKVSDKIPSKLLMVGDGGERSDCEQLARDLGVSDNVRFLGKQDAIEEILSVSDLFLMPSQSESFGLAALEAMACKVPVVSSNAGGLPELNIDGVTGFLREIGDVDGMAEKAIYILEDEDRLKTFKENALARAKEFDLSIILPVYENYYIEVIEKSKAHIL